MARGIERALAHDPAGELPDDIRVEEATRTVAQIAGDMMRGGQGNQVLALFAATAPKIDRDGADNAPRSALLEALNRLGNDADVAVECPDKQAGTGTADESVTYQQEPPNTQSGARPIEGQSALLDYLGAPLEQDSGAVAVEPIMPALGPGQAPRRQAPTPPGGHPPIGIALDTENFEKNPIEGMSDG